MKRLCAHIVAVSLKNRVIMPLVMRKMSEKNKTPKFDKNRMFESESALQKEIRRGNEKNAMFWAL